MEKIRWTWKKIITTLLGVLGIGTLTSCYGMPPRPSCTITGRVWGDIDGDGIEEPVPGIQVTMSSEPDYKQTDITREADDEDTEINSITGKFEVRDSCFTNKESYRLVFEDIDGEKNGSFKKCILKVVADEDSDGESPYIELGDIHLEPED